MPEDISAKVARLPHLPTSRLKKLWDEAFGRPAHAKIRRELVIPVLAYRLQEEAYGGVPKETLTRLHNLAKGIERNPRTVSLVNRIKPGTRLVRSWGGDSHEVTVISGGYSYCP